MAFVFCRENARGVTYYVGFYVDGKLVRQRVGRSKALAEKVRGDVEARVERGEAGLVRRHLAQTMGGFLDHELARLKTKIATIDPRAHVVESVGAILDRLGAEVSSA